MNYYLVNSTSGVIEEIYADFMPTPNANQLLVETVPADNRMVWDLVDTWVWAETGLLIIANEMFESRRQTVVDFNGHYIDVMMGTFVPQVVLSKDGAPEDETLIQSNVSGFTNDFFYMTNQEIIDAFVEGMSKRQQAVDVYQLIKADIISGVSPIVDPSTLETQWDAYDLTY